MTKLRRIGVAGLGAVGLPVVRALARGVDGLVLSAVASRDLDRARSRMAAIGADVAAVLSTAEQKETTVAV